MYRYKCRDCGGLSYSSSPNKAGEPCQYCGEKDVELDGINTPTPSAATLVMLAADSLHKEETPMNNNIDRTATLQLAIDTWGRSAQVDMMIEEMSELTKALLKERRKPPIPVSGLESAIMDIREEMADVQIMLDQMKLIYGDPADVEGKKLRRLAARLKGGDDE